MVCVLILLLFKLSWFLYVFSLILVSLVLSISLFHTLGPLFLSSLRLSSFWIPVALNVDYKHLIYLWFTSFVLFPFMLLFFIYLCFFLSFFLISQAAISIWFLSVHCFFACLFFFFVFFLWFLLISPTSWFSWHFFLLYLFNVLCRLQV